jgi:hypothetical protein
MGRGAEAATRRAADEERARQDALNAQMEQERQQQRQTFLPQYQDILAHPGYTDAEKAAIIGDAMGAAGSTFDAARNQAGERLARTGNSAGYGETLDELAREEARTKAGVAQGAQQGFADQAFRQRMAALQGLGGIYGVDTNLLARGLGIPPEYLNIRQQASRGGGFRFGFGPGGPSFGFGG